MLRLSPSLRLPIFQYTVTSLDHTHVEAVAQSSEERPRTNETVRAVSPFLANAPVLSSCSTPPFRKEVALPGDALFGFHGQAEANQGSCADNQPAHVLLNNFVLNLFKYRLVVRLSSSLTVRSLRL